MLMAVVAIFVILPFTTPITVFLGSHLNHFSLFKIWKELVMVLIVALIVLSGTYRRLTSIKPPLFKTLVWLICIYGVWIIALGVINLLVLKQINWEAFLYALIVDLRFLFFFLLCWLVAQDSPFLSVNWRKILLIPAAVVIGFGLLQHFVLPANILEHIGYGRDTITAYQTVDQNSEYIRIQSTLRGPNPLGAYLMVIVIALLIGFKKRWWPQAVLLVGSLTVLFYSYSRSAWLGMAAALGTLAYVSISNPRIRRNLTILGVIAVVLLSVAVYLGRDNQFIQKTVFHTDETSLSAVSSNEQRAGAIQQAINDVAHEPFGRGPGSAGPASLRNTGHAERISENYYLQIGQEVGWIGLSLFLVINVIIAMLLWQRRSDMLARILLASLVGITVVNMVSHAWTDETLSLLWWGLAGICLAPALLGQNINKKITLSTRKKDNSKNSQ